MKANEMNVSRPRGAKDGCQTRKLLTEGESDSNNALAELQMGHHHTKKSLDNNLIYTFYRLVHLPMKPPSSSSNETAHYARYGFLAPLLKAH